MEAIEELKKLQNGKENTPAWMIGQQLIDMIKKGLGAAGTKGLLDKIKGLFGK